MKDYKHLEKWPVERNVVKFVTQVILVEHLCGTFHLIVLNVI